MTRVFFGIILNTKTMKDIHYKKIRGLRQKLKWTGDELAAKMNISAGYLNKIERGYVKHIHNDHLRDSVIDGINLMEKELSLRG